MERRTYLAEIFAWEKQEDWPEAFKGYTSLYAKEPSIETAIHFAFFCWYMLWQWDEIQLPGEALSPYERMKTEKRCGLSRPVLFRDLDRTAEYLLADGRGTPARYLAAKYLAVLVHMRKIYPYFFKEETFPESMACHLLDQIRSGKGGMESPVYRRSAGMCRMGRLPVFRPGKRLRQRSCSPKGAYCPNILYGCFRNERSEFDAGVAENKPQTP